MSTESFETLETKNLLVDVVVDRLHVHIRRSVSSPTVKNELTLGKRFGLRPSNRNTVPPDLGQ